MPTRVGGTPVLTLLPESVPRIFEQAQTSTANHQKNFVALNKLHNEAALVIEPSENGKKMQLVGEKAFEDLFIDMLLRVLPLKKGATVVDRIVKFVAGYVKFINEKEKQGSETDDDDDTPASRFVSQLIKYLLKGFGAKDKNVRFRVLQIVTDMISNLGEIDEHVYDLLHESLLARARDKESSVRAQAVIALTKLLSPDNSDEIQDELMDVILDTLVHDPIADVRKTAMLNVPLTPLSIPAILSRTRDVDSSVRRAVYSVLEQLESPKQLTIAQRELVVKAGLQDREQIVRSSAAKLVGSWADLLNGDIALFIRLFDFDLMEDTENAAEQALLSLFDSRSDLLDSLEFSDTFWQQLTPERAFLARVFVEHCIITKDEARMESTMPVMTALAFKIQAFYNDLLRKAQADDENKAFGTEGSQEEETENAQLVLGELLKIAINMDYADEIGRRKMFALVREMISQDFLPQQLTSHCLDILRKLSSSERDLIRIVVEVIHELRDNDSDEDDIREKSADLGVEETPMPGRTPGRPRKPPAEMTPEEKEHADAIDLRCLSLCIGMLERVNSSFEENSTLEGILGELIIPAVKRKELPLREKGLISLGLCCLIARRMALNSFRLFLNQLASSPEPLRIRVLHIVFDVMMVHEGDFLGNTSVGGDKVVQFLTDLLERDDSPKVQAVLATGLAKMMLSGMVSDEQVLQSLVLAFMSPYTAENQELRQCLSYFFPVYCYSSSTNQRRMQQIFFSAYEELSKLHSELGEDEEMVDPLQAASLLLDWTDPQKVIEIPGQKVDKNVHFDLAIDIVRALLNKDFDRDDRKVLCQLLSKLYIPDEADDDKIRTLKLLMNNVKSRRPLQDTTSTNALTRFSNTISKAFEAQLEHFNEDEYRQLESLKDLFEFLDNILSDNEEEEPPKRGARKRRSESIATTTATSADDEEYRGTPEPQALKAKPKKKPKKRRISKSDDEDISDLEKTPPAAPTRTLPKRNVKAAPVVETVPDSEEEEEEEEEEIPMDQDDLSTEEATPPPKSRARDHRRRINEKSPVEQSSLIGEQSFVAEEAEEDDGEVDSLLGDL